MHRFIEHAYDNSIRVRSSSDSEALPEDIVVLGLLYVIVQ
jgi:hypothetical protein